jgi:hypothetical protein
LNISGQQSLHLTGEYLPANRGPPDPARDSLALPSGGAVLQRVTMVASRPGETLVLLRADYASPPAGRTYEGLASNASATDSQESARGSRALPSPAQEQNPEEQGARAGFGAVASAYLAPTAQYARTQGSGLAASTAKGAVIDVLA